MATGSSLFLDALVEARVSYIFANLGSDHPGLVEAIAEARALGKVVPTLITCPTEMVALSAAHGFAQVTGVAQAVLVHVECGTQSLAGAVHNAAKGRIPVLIFAGASPFTQHGELKGSRNEFIHWIQDVFDQRGLARGYVKYDNEIRTARNIKEITHRAFRFAYSDPKGPVYLMAAREVLEEAVDNPPADQLRSAPIAPCALPAESVNAIVSDLLRAKRPLVITSYVGRNCRAVDELVVLCDRLAIGVVESAPSYMNFPRDNPMYLANQWNDHAQNPVLASADVILVLDSDVPWIPLSNAPRTTATIYHIDIDPLKHQMPLSPISCHFAFQADAATALRQINARLSSCEGQGAAVEDRRAYYAQVHGNRESILCELERSPDDDAITPEYLTATIRGLTDPDTIVLNEGISNYQVTVDHLRMTRPGSMFMSGGGSLGWNGGAAIGAKLAKPRQTVISLTGDGSYLFSAPSAVHWMARRYRAPFLQVIYNNGGWKSPKLSTLAVHPSGYASSTNDLGVSLEPAPDHAAIAAAAGGAFARTVRRPGELQDAIVLALRAVRDEQRAAVLDIKLRPF